MRSPGVRNRLLATLPEGVAQRLINNAQEQLLPRGEVVLRSEASFENVYFLDSGMAVLVKIMSNGDSAAIGSEGIDGVLGISSLHGIVPSGIHAVMKTEGRGRRASTEFVKATIASDEQSQTLFQRYLSFRANQIAQTAACNQLHTLRQRCCRWLLTARDNVEEDTFSLTHDFLALMLGVHRPGVSLAIETLKRENIVTYDRMVLTITDRRALEANACECYGSLKRLCDQVFWSPSA